MELSTFNNSLSPQGAEELANELDRLLVNVQVYRQNIRKMYWNNEIKPFLKLHDGLGKLDEMVVYGEDVLAHKIMALGHTPSNSPSEYLMTTDVTAIDNIFDFDNAIKTVIQSSKELLNTVKDVFDIAVELEEKETINMMGQIARQLSINIYHFAHLRMATLN